MHKKVHKQYKWETKMRKNKTHTHTHTQKTFTVAGEEQGDNLKVTDSELLVMP